MTRLWQQLWVWAHKHPIWRVWLRCMLWSSPTRGIFTCRVISRHFPTCRDGQLGRAEESKLRCGATLPRVAMWPMEGRAPWQLVVAPPQDHRHRCLIARTSHRTLTEPEPATIDPAQTMAAPWSLCGLSLTIWPILQGGLISPYMEYHDGAQ